MTAPLITADLVDLDVPSADRQATVDALARRLQAAGRVTDLDRFLADIEAREAQMPTGLEGGIGIPHCRSTAVTEPSLAFGRSTSGVDFGAEDGPANLIFMIAAPEGGNTDHMTVLAALARRLVRASFKNELLNATDDAAVAAYIQQEVGSVKLLAVTACPTGIAHTYMAAEALEVAAEEAGHELVVETQGSAGSTPFTDEQLAEADAIILAADVEVRDKDRFAHLPTVTSGVKKAIGGAPGLIEAAVAEATAHPKPAPGAGVPAPRESREMAVKASGPGFGSKLRGWLMTGVSYVIPFVAAGGLLIALGFALGGYQVSDAPDIVSVGDDGVVTSAFNAASLGSWAALSFQIGSLAFSLLVPVLAGFIAYAIADRPALVPGFVGGLIAVQTQAGFLGGLVAGLLAGALIYWLKQFRVPRALAGIMPVLVLPLIGTAVVGTIMFVVVGQPLAAATTGLTSWLNGLSGSNAVLLGALLGLMMAFDMGGPVNKAAYAFAVAGLSTGSGTALLIMASVMAAGMTPPLAMALASTVRKNLFTEAERENGRAAWLLGISFITEGAIPFAAGDPLRVIPSLMVGSAVTGSLSMAFGSTLRAPHGGIFVVPLIGNPFAYLFAIAVGTVISAAMVIVLKSAGKRRTAQADVPATAPATAAVAAS